MDCEDYLSIENQIKRKEENDQLRRDEKRYRKELGKSSFSITPDWKLNKNDINLEHLGNDRHIELKSVNDFSIYAIPIDTLVELLHESCKVAFDKNKIWENHDSIKITRVLRHWQHARKLIPPVLIFSDDDKNLIIQDGKHRFAVANYFDVNEIPIIVLKSIERQFLILANGKSRKIE